MVVAARAEQEPLHDELCSGQAPLSLGYVGELLPLFETLPLESAGSRSNIRISR